MQRAGQFSSLVKKLNLQSPVIATYDLEPDDAFAPLVTARARVCCFAFYGRWQKGHTLVVEKGNGDFANPDSGCPGMQVAFGLGQEYPTYMKNFLTDGEGAPKGEGLKASPDLAQQWIDHTSPPDLKDGAIMLGPLRFDYWEAIRSITFFARPDQLSALITLATYHSGPDDVVVAPFSSGCGLMLRELENQDDDRAVLGSTDIAMRKYIPADIMSLTVSPSRFDRMTGENDGSFLERSWWHELLESRESS